MQGLDIRCLLTLGSLCLAISQLQRSLSNSFATDPGVHAFDSGAGNSLHNYHSQRSLIDSIADHGVHVACSEHGLFQLA